MLKILSYQKEGKSKTDVVVDKPGSFFCCYEKICKFCRNELDTYDHYKTLKIIWALDEDESWFEDL